MANPFWYRAQFDFKVVEDSQRPPMTMGTDLAATTVKESPFNRECLPRSPMDISERRLLLMVLDVLMLNGALLLALALGSGRALEWRPLTEDSFRFLLLAGLWLPLASAFDAYDLRVTQRPSISEPHLLKAWGITSVAYLVISYLIPPLRITALAPFLFLLLSLTLLMVGRGVFALSLTRLFFHRRAVIIGAGRPGRTIAQTVTEYGDGTYRLVGFVDNDPGKQCFMVSVPHCSGQSSDIQAGRILGDYRSLPSLIAEHHLTTLILAIPDEINADMLQILMDCLELGMEIIPMPVLYEQLTGRVPVDQIGGDWYVAMPIRHPATRGFPSLTKRAMDVTLAGLGLVWLGLVLPFIATAIYLDSPGPIFYTQERVGRGGRRFRAYKFRSMVPDAEKDGAVWAQQNDCRITRIGRILRATHTDEFPQFLNILKGEMSVVGPRPERPEFVEELAREIPFYRIRHAVKPGMAGWGLVKQGYGASKEDAFLKLQYDLYYIKHQSVWLDIVILVKTFVDMITLRGR